MKTKLALVTYAAIFILGLVQADNVDLSSTPVAEQVCRHGDDTCAADLEKKVQEATVGIDNIDIEAGDAADDDDDDDDYGYIPHDSTEMDDYYEDFDDDDDDHEEEKDDHNDEECRDGDERCDFWASENECESNPGYMLHNCQKSCGTCAKSSPSTIEEGYGATYGEPQECSGQHKDDLLKRVEKMDKYMAEEVIKPEFDNVRHECKNRNALCLFWAHIGECEANPNFMLINCAPSCETCKNIDFNFRCPKDPNLKNVFGSGDLHKMFERIVDENDNVTVLSQPPTEDGAKFSPWVITIDDFITDDECQKLIELGAESGYQRSTDVGAKKFDGTYEEKKSTSRTSENAWCTDACYDEPLTQTALQRIEKLTGVPDSHSEYLQLLKYEEGQFYRTHHDYIEHDDDRPQGPRILTAFLYLNDVEAGGGTNFPDLDLTVMPKKGRLLLWPSVIDSDPSKKDFTTRHQALNVEAGEKYGANSWLHLRDFKKPHDDGCT